MRLFVGLLSLLPLAPAHLGSGDSVQPRNTESVIEKISPAVPDGVKIEIVGADTFVRLTAVGVRAEVRGYDKEPYLRINENGLVEKGRSRHGRLNLFFHERTARKTAGEIRMGPKLYVVTCMGVSLPTHGVHDSADDETGDRRQDQRPAESVGEAPLPAVEEAKQAADEKDDPSGLPPALQISHARGVVAHGYETATLTLTGKF